MEKGSHVLVIVESPTKARLIGSFLPKSTYTVIASKGHIRDLPEKSMGIEMPGYKPEYEISAGKTAVVKQLKDALKKSDYLLLATDEVREGEAISWHLLQVLKPKVPYERMVFHEITKKAITQALDNGRPLDEALVKAQEARRIIDRLFGYAVSPILCTKLAQKKLSAGRVQSVGLRLAVNRERERITFKSHTWCDAVATLKSENGASYQARLSSIAGKSLAGSKDFDSVSGDYKGKDKLWFETKADAAEAIASLKDEQWQVTDIQTKPASSHPAWPFTTSTLQQEGVRKLHMGASMVMSTAQALYENGFITYMRTDSPALSQEGTYAARAQVEELYGKDYLSPYVRTFHAAKDSGAQEAHEAIRPAGTRFRTPEETGLSGRELALYTLIWKRTLACQMADARKATTTVTVKAGDAVFAASGTQILFPGFIRVYSESLDEGKDVLLPNLEKGEVEELEKLDAESHDTKARPRYTEASLVEEMEKREIGRPSTYATIIKTLLDRGYVVKQGGALVPTFSGWGVCQYLEQFFPQFVDYDFTRKMEGQLDEVASHKEDEGALLKEFNEGPGGLDATIKLAKPVPGKESRRLVLPQLDEAHSVYLGPYGPFVMKPAESSDGKATYVSVPDDWYPGMVTPALVDELLASKSAQTDAGADASGDLGDGITLKNGRFGWYWSKDGKNASVPSWMDEAEKHDPENAKKYLMLPRMLGKDSEGHDVVAASGKYGPYVGSNGTYRNLAKNDHDAELFSITLEQALSLLAQPKPAARGKGRFARKGSGRTVSVASTGTPIGDFEGSPVQVAHGRYGWYLKHGKDNYALPNEMKKDEAAAKAVTLQQAVEIIERKRQKDAK